MIIVYCLFFLLVYKFYEYGDYVFCVKWYYELYWFKILLKIKYFFKYLLFKYLKGWYNLDFCYFFYSVNIFLLRVSYDWRVGVVWGKMVS